MAVVSLAARVQYSHKIKPVCLPSSPGQDYGGMDAMAAGFGRGDNWPTTVQHELMKKIVTLTPDEKCHHHDNNMKMICSTEPGFNGPAMRLGDSGSALNLKEDGRSVNLQSFVFISDIYHILTFKMQLDSFADLCTTTYFELNASILFV